MKKSTAIAKALKINTGADSGVRGCGEWGRVAFEERFPNDSFDDWNTSINARLAAVVVGCGRAFFVDVPGGIKALWAAQRPIFSCSGHATGGRVGDGEALDQSKPAIGHPGCRHRARRPVEEWWPARRPLVLLC